MRLRLSICLVIACAIGMDSPRAQGQNAATGLIVGQVVDAVSGRGVPEAIISISMMRSADGVLPPAQLSADVRRRVIADDDGRYFFTGLPEGRFSLTVAKRGYVGGSFGQRRPGGTLQYVDLLAGQRRGDTDVRLWSAAAVEGQVTDERGEPVVNAVVTAVKRVDTPGRPRFIGASLFARTDDRGIYRIAGLEPGSYLVLMSGSRTTFPVETLAPEEIPNIRSEAYRVTNEIQAMGGERHLTRDRFVLATPSSTPTLPPQVSGQPLRVYPQVVHPSLARMDQAEPIVLGAGQTRRSVDLQIRAVSTISVSGRVISPDAAIGVTAIRLVPEGQAALIGDKGFDTASALTRKDGTFTILGVPEGRYELRINSPRPLDPKDTTPDAPSDTYWASVPIDAGTRDIVDLVVPVTRTPPLLGRVQFDGTDTGKPAAAEYVNLDPASSEATRATARVKPDGRFALSTGPGKYIVFADPPAGWTLKSVTHNGRDVVDSPLTIASDPIVDVIVTFTKQSASLSGTVRDQRQATDTNAAVILIPAEPRMWLPAGLVSRRFVMARVNATGAYRIAGIPPGDYLALALDDADTANWRTPERVAQLAVLATRVTIATGSSATLDLKTVVPPSLPASEPTLPMALAAQPVDSLDRPHGPFVDENQNPPRDAAATVTPSGTGRVEGRVVGTGEPAASVRGALVNLRATDRPWGSTAVTNDDGRFVFDGVPAGRFSLVATKPAWLSSTFGASRPGRPGTPITLTEAQHLDNLTLVMARGAVITGRVFDQQGRPVQGVDVQALAARLSPSTGERQMQPVGIGTTSDDQGTYRLWGLGPGSYVVRAAPAIEGRPQQQGGLAVAQLSRAEVDRAHSLLSGGRAANAAPVDVQRPLTEGVVTVYSPIFAPGTSDITQASAITLSMGEEHSGADVALSYTPAVRVRGAVLRPDGTPAANVTVEALPGGPSAALLQLAATVSSQARTDAAGGFVLPPLAPGAYLIRATARGESVMFAASEVIALTDMVTSLSLAPAPSLTVRLEFEGAEAPPAESPVTEIRLMSMGSGPDMTNAPRGTLDGPGRIVFPAIVPGRYSALFMGGSRSGDAPWTRYESVANGRDTFEHGIEIGATGTVDWSIRYTRQPSRLEGSFSDASGRPAPEYFILVFPQDKARWVGQSVRIRLLRPDLAGAFSVVGLPDGAYYLAALADVMAGEERDAEFLAALVPSALSINLERGKTTRQDIRIGTGR